MIPPLNSASARDFRFKKAVIMPEVPSPQKDLGRLLIDILVKMEVIDPSFVGSVTIHIGQGAISDIDRYEKSLLRLRRSAIRLPRLSK